MNILTRNHIRNLCTVNPQNMTLLWFQDDPSQLRKFIAQAANVIELRYKALCNIVHRHVALGRAETVEPARDDCHQGTSTDPFSEHPKPSTIWRDGRNMEKPCSTVGPTSLPSSQDWNLPLPRAQCKRDAFRSSQERFIAHRFHLTQPVLHMLLEKCESQ